MDEPVVNIKDYVIKSRQAGITDSKIIEELKKNNWPEDIITSAVDEANAVIGAVPEPVETEEKGSSQTNTTTSSIQPTEQKSQTEKTEQQTATKEETSNQNKDGQKKKFCFTALFALLSSPIPIVGLYLGATALDIIRTKKMKGAFLAVLAMLLNVGATIFVFYVFYIIINFNNTQMEGFAGKIGGLLEGLGLL